jgi:hypothetical protein
MMSGFIERGMSSDMAAPEDGRFDPVRLNLA